MKFPSPLKNIAMLISASMFVFSASAAQDAGDGKVYKLPPRTQLATIPYATTPYRMQWMLNCDAVPANCLIPTSSLFTPWQDIGAPFDFTTWLPVAKSQINDFVQSRDYQQTQEQYEQKRFQHKETGDYSNDGLPIRHERDVTRSEDRLVDVSFSSWVNDGANHTCQDWTPSLVSVPFGQDFDQSRGCLEPETRDRIYIADVGEIAREIERRNVADTETRSVVTSTNGWSYTSGEKNVSSWSPAAAGQTNDYAQAQTYQRDRARTWTYKSGGITLDQRIESDTESLSRNRAIDVSVSNWADTKRTDYSSWSPAPASQISDFTQSRGYTQNQTRTWTHKDGTSTIHSRVEDRSVANESESRTVSVNVSGWSYTSSGYAYGSYSPAYGSQTSDYTQSRSYKRDRARTWTYTADGSAIHSRVEEDTRSLTDSRTVSVSNSGWVNTTASGYSSWSPSPSSQTSNYTQSRSYTQDQKLTYIHKVGTTTVHTRDVTRSLSGQSQTRSVSVTWSGWSNSGSKTCGSWTPSASNYFEDESVNQTRSCSTPQSGSYTHKVGATTIHTRAVSRSYGTTETRTVMGIKPVYPSAQETYCTAWSNSGSIIYGGYSPTPSSRGYNTSSYTQSRTRTQPQARTCYERQYNAKTSTWDKMSANRTETRNTSLSNQTRSVSVTTSSWVNNGTITYGSWTTSGAPAGQERRAVNEPQKRTLYHKVGTSTIYTRTQTRTNTTYQYRSSNTWTYSGYEMYRTSQGSPGSQQVEGGSCSTAGAEGWSSRYPLTDDDITQCAYDDSCTGKVIAYDYRLVTCQ